MRSRPSRCGARLLAGLVLLALIAGCGRPHPAAERPAANRPAGGPDGPRALPLAILADTGRTTTLRVRPPAEDRGASPGAHATAWLTRVAPAQADLGGLPAPEPSSDTLVSGPPPARPLVVDDRLKPPLPRERSPLVVPRGAHGSVELDVRVDERGAVSDVRWAAGSRDPAMVSAASDCARAMRFFPAEQAGRPVAVWCRQRFDFGVEEP